MGPVIRSASRVRSWIAAAALAALPVTAPAQAPAAPTEVRSRIDDTLSVVADVHRARVAADGPVVLLFHQGGGSARGEYRAITPRLVAAGYHVVAADVRGGGDRFGVPSRAPAVDSTFSYCHALAEVEAAMDLTRGEELTGPLALWGSSYTAALVLQAAARRSADVRAVLAFSPASGPPMRGCEPAAFIAPLVRAGVPALVLRPRVELADTGRLAALEAMRRDGAAVHIAERGVHGSSMLDAERTRASTEPEWSVVLAFLRRSLGPAASDSSPRGVRFTYLANEGVMLAGSGGIVLIDALFGDGLPEYATVPPAARDTLERAGGAFGGPAVVLTTHPHRDHYDSAAHRRYLRHNPRATAVGPRATESAPLPPPQDLGWVRIRPLDIPHGPTVRPVGHSAYLVALDDLTALHVGDTSSDPASWTGAGVPPEGVDVALIPYWYALDRPRWDALLRVLRPGTVILLHTPQASGGSRPELEGLGERVRIPRSFGETILLHQR